MVQIGGEEVIGLKEAAARIGVSHDTLIKQANRGVLRASRIGRQWVVTASALAEYERDHKGRHGFAAGTHPMHGKQGPGHRRRKSENPKTTS